MHIEVDENVSRLINELAADRITTRRIAARELRRYGEKAAIAIPYLTEALEDYDATVRCEALRSLEQLSLDAA